MITTSQKTTKAEIQLIKGINAEGINFFAYIAALPERAKELQIALRSGRQPKLEEYGAILYLGQGEPSEQLSKDILANFQ